MKLELTKEISKLILSNLYKKGIEIYLNLTE
jgi:hypothetical protein